MMAAGNGSPFNGMVSLTVLEAQNLKSITLPGGFQLANTAMDPYCVIDFDDFFFGRSTAKTRTPCPVWNETFEEPVEDAVIMQLAVFHKSTIPPDPFIAHVQIDVSEMMKAVEDEFMVSYFIRWNGGQRTNCLNMINMRQPCYDIHSNMIYIYNYCFSLFRIKYNSSVVYHIILISIDMFTPLL